MRKVAFLVYIMTSQMVLLLASRYTLCHGVHLGIVLPAPASCMHTSLAVGVLPRACYLPGAHASGSVAVTFRSGYVPQWLEGFTYNKYL